MSRRFAMMAAAAALCLLAYTKMVWQSGFDQGNDVALCVVATVIDDGRLATGHPACRRADAYKSNPLWSFRRRNGGAA